MTNKNIYDSTEDFIIVDDQKIKKDDIDFEDEKYQTEYNDTSFWDKIKQTSKKIGLKSLFYALVLYYVLQKKEVTLKEKTLIIGALGYLILPLDLIPDAIPFAGFVDDGFALMLAVKKIIHHVDENVITKAHLKISKWFDISKDNLKKFI